MGLLKTQNKNPYGVIYKTPYPFFNCMKINRK